MQAPRLKSLNAALSLALITGLLSGCSSYLEEQQTDNPAVAVYRDIFHHAKWRQSPEPFENYVEPITLSHDVLFQPGQAAITATGRNELHAFLRAEQIGSDEQIVLRAPGNGNGGRDALTMARLASLKTELERSGLVVAVASNGGDSELLEPDQVAVSVTRMLVLSPDCDVPQPAHGERPDYRFSCADTVNLGNMVVDPNDLVRGREFEPSDGEASARRIEAYRTGDVEAEEIIIEATE